MNEKYRLMIYFAHSTMVMYEASITSKSDFQVVDFIKCNGMVLERVCKEAFNIFNYELSMQQIQRAVYTYLSAKYHPQSIENTKAYQP